MTSQIKKNHNNGFNYEHRFVKALLKKGAQKAVRHYGSRGTMDIEWTDSVGFKNEAQLKYSTKKLPIISPKEKFKIQAYAIEKKKEGIKVWIVCKQARGPEVWEAMN